MSSALDAIPPDALCEPASPTERSAGGRLLARAPAKLNLVLRVGPVRADGFHPIDSIVAKVTLYDELIFSPRDDDEVMFACDDASVGDGEDNLVVRAARLVQSLNAGRGGADIELRKRIAAAAGLGGGSADAAVTLRMLNEMWSCGLSDEQLAAAAAKLGSDVPLTLGAPASRAQGRGEILTPVELPPFAAVLVTPPVHCPTAAVYRAFDVTPPAGLPPVDAGALTSKTIEQWPDLLVNDLLAPAVRVCPAISEWIDRLEKATRRPVHLTGSGSALFCLAADMAEAASLYRHLPAALADAARIVSLNGW